MLKLWARSSVAAILGATALYFFMMAVKEIVEYIHGV